MSLGSDHTGWNETGHKTLPGAPLAAANGLAAIPGREEAVRNAKASHAATGEPSLEGGSVMERLRSTMGDERANGVIRTIGTAALNAAPNGLPVSLDSIVSGTLNRLTQADLAGLVRGDTGVINRVGAMAEEQVKAAQAAQPSPNVHAAPSAKADGTASYQHGGVLGAKLAAFNGGDRARSDAASGNPATNSNAYGRTFMGAAGDPAFLQSQGLTPSIGKELGKLGFTKPEQIREIVNDANTLHLAPKEAAVDLAHLRHGEGARTGEHIEALKHYGEGLAAARAAENEAHKIKEPAKRAEAMRKAAEMRRQAEEKADKHERERVRSAEGRRGFRGTRNRIREKHGRQVELKGEQKAEHKSQVSLVADTRRDGTQRLVEGEHRKIVAQLERKPEAEKSAADGLLALDGSKPETKPIRQASKLGDSSGVRQKAKAEVPKRLAMHSKGLNPKA